MAIIQTHQLSKSYRVRGRPIEAVKGIDIEVHAGEIFGFLGPNGAGKTTTMRMLTTLLPPTEGSATVVGHDLVTQQQEVRRQIGYVSQAGGTEQSCTARENLVLQGRLYRLPAAEAEARAAHLIEALELAAIADRRASTYSGGQRRRLDLALGMVHQPKLLFLDEPTTGLDPQSRARLWDEIRHLRAQGTTVFMTTHYLEEVDALCDRLAIIDHGELVACDTPNNLKRQIMGDTITLGLSELNGERENAESLLANQPFIISIQSTHEGLRLAVKEGEAVLPQVLRVLDAAGLPLRTVSLARPSLDDVFLQQTGRSLREAELTDQPS